MFKRKRPSKPYLEWGDYEDMIETLDLLTWQQATRKQSLRNALAHAP